MNLFYACVTAIRRQQTTGFCVRSKHHVSVSRRNELFCDPCSRLALREARVRERTRPRMLVSAALAETIFVFSTTTSQSLAPREVFRKLPAPVSVDANARGFVA